MKRLCTLLLACLLGIGAAGTNDVEAAKQEIRDGEFEQALARLALAARQITASGRGVQQLAEVYLYMGVAYTGLHADLLASARYQQALQLDPNVAPSPAEFPRRVVKAFEDARSARKGTDSLVKESRKKRIRGGLVLLGIGGVAVAGGVALDANKRKDSGPNSVSISVTPDDPGIAGLTVYTFGASASDAEGDPLSFAWDFGDSGGEETSTGTEVTHVYDSSGDFTVRLRATDPSGQSATSERDVVVRGVDGLWFIASGVSFGGEKSVRLESGFSSVICAAADLGSEQVCEGGLFPPRNIAFAYSTPAVNPACIIRFDGQLDADLATMSGTATKLSDLPRGRGCRPGSTAMILRAQR